MERLFSTVCYFISHFCWSVNYMSRVSRFHNFLFEMLRNWGQVFIWGILVLSCMESSILMFQHFFSLFFYLVCKLFKSLFKSHFVGQKIVWVEPLISEMFRSLNMNLYLRAFSIAIYQKFDLYYLCLFRLFSGLQIVQFWSVNYASYFRSS